MRRLHTRTIYTALLPRVDQSAGDDSQTSSGPIHIDCTLNLVEGGMSSRGCLALFFYSVQMCSSLGFGLAILHILEVSDKIYQKKSIPTYIPSLGNLCRRI